MKQFFTIIFITLSLVAKSRNYYDSLNKPLPANWYNESSVILFHKISFNLNPHKLNDKSFHLIYNSEIVIRLNDKAAIENYNSLDFPKELNIEIDVINKNGDIVNVVTDEDDYWNQKIESFKDNYSDLFELIVKTKNEKRKYAIPDLDTGDLLVIKSKFNGVKYNSYEGSIPNDVMTYLFYTTRLIVFSPGFITSHFNDNYSQSYFEYLKLDHIFNNDENTLYKIYEISLHKDLYVNYETKNSCKPFKITFDKRSKKNTYTISDSFLIKNKSEIWSSNYLDNPYFYFKVFYPNKKVKAMDKEIFNNKTKTLSNFNSKQVKIFYKKNERFLYANNKEKFKEYHKKNPKAKTILDPKKYIFEYLNFKKAENFNKFLDGGEDQYKVSFYSKEIVLDLVSIAKRFLLPYNVYLIVPKELGNLENISSVDKFRYAIEINFKSGPLTFYGSEINSLGLIKPTYISGAEAYKIKGKNYSKLQPIRISKVKLPEFNDIENGTLTEININLNPDSSTTKVHRKTSYLGSYRNKLQYSESFIYYFIDSILNSSSEINKDLLVVEPELYKSDFSDEDLLEENERLINSFKISTNEFFKQSSLEKLSEEFLVSKVDTSYLDFSKYINDFFNPIYHTEVFDIEGFVYKTPTGIVVNLGSLIESQIDLVDEDDRNRSSSIVQPSLRKFENKIRIKIPNGYKPIGLDNFKFNIDNEMGSFITNVSFSNGNLEITVLKSYKKIYAEKENWPKYLEFLDAANDFKYKKLILEKN